MVLVLVGLALKEMILGQLEAAARYIPKTVRKAPIRLKKGHGHSSVCRQTTNNSRTDVTRKNSPMRNITAADVQSDLRVG
jgi:hypothetical protein